jgi:exopolysaccharide biosynthesis protein
MLGGMKRLLAFILSCAVTCGCLRADPMVEKPYPGVTVWQEVRTDPPQRLMWAMVDLAEPRVSVHVSRGGADPDGEGPWQTTLMPPTAIAKREGFELAVNGDFFSVKKQEGGAGGYTAEQWASVPGPAATNGASWASSPKARPCLVVKKSGKVAIERLAKAGPDDAQVIAGNVMLVEAGKAAPPENAAKHPRTVVGLDEKGTRLTILVVEGRRAGEAVGMDYAELAKEMLAAGCFTALNLDGGGSSVMIVRTGEKFVIRNKPSDNKERPVANVLGVDVKDAK